MVQSTPHGEGNVRDHVNTNYDPDEDNQIENVDSEAIQDIVGGFIEGSGGASISYDDPDDVLVVDASGAGNTTEEVEDIVGALVTGGNNTLINYDDSSDTLSIHATIPEPDIAELGNTTLREIDPATWTDMEFDFVNMQSDSGIIDASTANNEVIIKDAGLYRIEGSIRFVDTGVEYSSGDLIRYAADYGGNQFMRDNTTYRGVSPTAYATQVIEVLDGETPRNISASIYQDGGSTNQTGGNSNYNYLRVQEVRDSGLPTSPM